MAATVTTVVAANQDLNFDIKTSAETEAIDAPTRPVTQSKGSIHARGQKNVLGTLKRSAAELNHLFSAAFAGRLPCMCKDSFPSEEPG
jgi:hypothetical protein